MDRPIQPVTYEQLDHWIHALQPELAQEGFACSIGILRGGAPLALMVSHAIGAPVAFLRYRRHAREVVWDSSIPMPAPGSKVLLCEDIAGLGHTLADCAAFLRAHGLAVKTLTAGFDELSRTRPDYGVDSRGYFLLFPWERHAHTDAYRESWQRAGAGTAGCIGEDHEFDAYGIDLDGILLPDVPPQRYTEDLAAALRERDGLEPCVNLPLLDVRRAKVIVTGRPEMDRVRTEAWLQKYGFDAIPLVMRDPASHGDTPESVAMHKARAAVRHGCTHFVESDPVQALAMAQAAPLLRVVWWDASTACGRLVAAQLWQRSASG